MAKKETPQQVGDRTHREALANGKSLATADELARRAAAGAEYDALVAEAKEGPRR